jgi:hypothetical protein
MRPSLAIDAPHGIRRRHRHSKADATRRCSGVRLPGAALRLAAFAPFRRIAGHVIQPKRIGHLAADRVRTSVTVFRKPAFAEEVLRRIARVVLRRGPRSAGIDPFVLGRQLRDPAIQLRRTHLGQAAAEGFRIRAFHILDGMPRSKVVARVASPDGFVLRLRDFVLAQPESFGWGPPDLGSAFSAPWGDPDQCQFAAAREMQCRVCMSARWNTHLPSGTAAPYIDAPQFIGARIGMQAEQIEPITGQFRRLDARDAGQPCELEDRGQRFEFGGGELPGFVGDDDGPVQQLGKTGGKPPRVRRIGPACERGRRPARR